jgi:hypothetical protein
MELINKANDIWDRRNAQAVEEGETELPRLLPLVRLKVDDSLILLCGTSPQGVFMLG